MMLNEYWDVKFCNGLEVCFCCLRLGESKHFPACPSVVKRRRVKLHCLSRTCFEKSLLDVETLKSALFRQ